MHDTELDKRDKFRTAVGTIAVSSVFAAALTYFTVMPPNVDALTATELLQLVATWLGFTILLVVMFAAGIWRMTGRNKGDESDILPSTALIVLASVVGLCGLSPILVFQLAGVVNTQVILYGVLVLSCVVAFAIVHFLKRRNPPAGGPPQATDAP